MKLQLTASAGLHMFSGYGAGYVVVNHVRYEKNMLVTPQAVTEWAVASFAVMAAADFDAIVALQPEIVILGTGATQRFPRPELARALAASGVGLEVMDSKAACRTYNILAAEGRKVVAAILVE